MNSVTRHICLSLVMTVAILLSMQAFAQTEAPDMVVSALTIVTSAPVSGGSVQVTETTANQGSGAAGSSTTGFYLSADGTTKGNFLGSRSVPALAGGVSSGPTTTTLSLPVNVNGSYYVMACADTAPGSGNQVAESSENNNCTAGPMQVAGADLAVSGTTIVTSTPVSGGSVQVMETTTNQGSGAAGSSTTGFYLSVDGTTKGNFLGSRSVPALAGGVSSGPTTTTLSLPVNVNGSYYVMACADTAPGSGNQVAESSENNNCSSAGPMQVLPPASIASLSPTSGAVGSSVTITGTNFRDSQQTNTVTFNGTAGVPTSWTNTSIVVPVPSGATTGNVVVQVGGVASNGVGFTVFQLPTIASLTPASGAVGTSVTITGSSFGATQGTNTVTFNGVAATPTSWSDTQIVVAVPVDAVTGNVVVTASSGASNGVSFTVTPPLPTIASLFPSVGRIGDAVTISGSNFGAAQGTSTVTFDGIAATITSWSDTAIQTTAPTGATAGSVVVTVNTTASNAAAFTIETAPPFIAGVSPSSGGIGTRVTLTGTAFGGAQGTSGVSINGVKAIAVNWSDTTVSVEVPEGLTPGSATVTLTAAGTSSNEALFTVTEPLTIVPSEMGMLVSESRSLQALDDDGNPLPTVTWSVKDESVAEVHLPVNTGDPTLITAKAFGTTKLIATFGDRTGNAKVNVYEGGALPLGTVRWSVPPMGAGGWIVKTVEAIQQGGTGPAFFIKEINRNNEYYVRAIGADGQLKWSWGLYRYPDLVASDMYGGVLAFAYDDNFDPYLARLDSAGTETWSRPTYAFGEEHAIAPDGTIYLKESPGVVVALDPTNGQTKFSVPIPMSQVGDFNWDYAWHFYNNPDISPNILVCTPGSGPLGQPNGFRSVPTAGGRLSVAADGTVYLPFTVSTTIYDGTPCSGGTPYGGTKSYSGSLQLLKIQLDGTYSTVQLDSVSSSVADWATPIQQVLDQSGRAIPDGNGGAVLPARNGSWGAYTSRIYLDSGTSYSSPVDLADTPDEPLLIGPDNTAYIAGTGSVAAFDIATGAIKWTWHDTACVRSQWCVFPNTVTADGSIIVKAGTAGPDILVQIDPTGQATALPGTEGLPAGDDLLICERGCGNSDTLAGSFADAFTAIVTGPAAVAAGSYSQIGGHTSRENAADPGLKLVGTQDCGLELKSNGNINYERFPSYALRDKNDQRPTQNYTVFEWLPDRPDFTSCYFHEQHTGESPCSYVVPNDTDPDPYNKFEDWMRITFQQQMISKQFFLYGVPNQRRYGVRTIERTTTEGRVAVPRPYLNLNLTQFQKPTINGFVWPYIAPWDGDLSHCRTPYNQ